MTLDRHKSHLIPEIDFGGDGRLFVTDREGTFPLAAKKGKRERLPPRDYDVEADVKSFRSYDRNRDVNRYDDTAKRRYRQNNSKYEREIAAMSGTWSSGGGGSSLARKVRRNQTLSRGDGKTPYLTTETGSVRGSRLRGGTPQMPQEFSDSVNRKNKHRKSLDIEKLRRSNKKGDKTYFGRVGSDYGSNNGNSPLLLWEAPSKHRKISEERLPGLVFIVTGVFLLVLGVLRVFLSYWHEYYCGLWTGALAVILGILGLTHKGMYLSRKKNGAYITFGLLTSLATMASSCIVLHVLIPLMTDLAMGKKAEYVASHVDFTNMNDSVVSIDMNVEEVVWISLSLDFSSLIMFLVNYFAMTATMVAVGNHWDAEYGSSGVCDHRGNPRLFNPLEQISVGQATSLVGCAAVVLQQSDQAHYWSPVWSGAAVMMAGFVSTCSGKRPESKFLGVYAMVWEVIALLSCGGAIAFSTLALEDDVHVVEVGEDKAAAAGNDYDLCLASVVGHGVFLLLMIVNVVFVFGIMFRMVRTLTGGSECMPRSKQEAIIETTSL